MARTRELKVVVAGDSDALVRSLKKSGAEVDKFSKKTDDLGKKTRLTASITSKGFHGMRLAATGAVGAIGGLTFAIKGAVDAASDINESLTKNQALFGSNAKAIERYAKTTAASLGISRREALQAAGTFGGLFDAINIGEKQSAKMSKRLVTLAADLASFNNASPEEALEALRSGLAGEAEPMRKFNAFLSETRVQAEAASMGIGKTAVDTVKLKVAQESASIAQERYNIAVQRFGAGSIEARTAHLAVVNAQERAKKATAGGTATLTEAQKVQARYSLILKDTAKAHGDFGKTAGGAANQSRILKAQYDDMTSALGSKLLPVKVKVTRALNKFIGEMQSGTGQGGKFVDKMKEIGEELRPIVEWLGRAAKNVAEFAAKHPQVTKLAGEVVALGFAIKGLKFVSAASGFTDLLKTGRSVTRTLVKIFAKRGAEAGVAAGTAAAGSEGLASGAVNSLIQKTGTKSGRLFGKALGVGMIAGIALTLPEVNKQLSKLLGAKKGTPSGAGSALIQWLFKADGGKVPGRGTGDTVPAMLTPGEFVIRKQVVDRFGPTFFAGLNGGMGVGQGNRQVPGFTSGGIVNRANKMDAMDLPYLWGGGHGGSISRGVDCSGAVSYALGVSPRVSGAFMSYGKPGPGSPNDTKIYANPRHVFAVFNGRGWGTSHENPGGGPGWLSYNSRSGFTVRHLEDSAGSSRVGTVGQPQESSSQEAVQKRIDATDDRIAGLRDQLARAPKGLAGAVQRDRINDQIRALTGSKRTLSRTLRDAPSASDITARQERSGSRLFNRIAAPFAKGIREATRGAADLGASIDDQGTRFGQAERLFGLTDEDLGTAGGRAHRIGELAALSIAKRKTLNDQRKRAQFLKRAISKTMAELEKLRAARDKQHGAKRAKMSERIRPVVDRLDDLRAELHSLSGEIVDTQLDIGDLAKEAGEVAKTPDTESTVVSDTQEKIAQAVSDIDLMERAGLITPDQANQMRVATLTEASKGRFGALDQRGLLQVLADLGDASKAQSEAQVAQTQALNETAQALKDLQDELARNTAVTNSILAVEYRTALAALADSISGQIVGHDVNQRALTAGTGALARY